MPFSSARRRTLRWGLVLAATASVASIAVGVTTVPAQAAGPASSRWSTVDASSRWSSTPDSSRWSTVEASSRWSSTPGSSRWSAAPDDTV